MWDLKLFINEFFFYINFFLYDVFFKFLNFLDPYMQNGLTVFNSKIFYQFPQNMTFFFAIKFCLCIAFLVLIRGGAPRYRYDYLTKLGWLKFLGFIILIFFLNIFFFLFFVKMKLERLHNFLNFVFNFKFVFFFNFIKQSWNNFLINYFFNWKIANYGDSYWFFYSNKKSLHELRHLNKK